VEESRREEEEEFIIIIIIIRPSLRLMLPVHRFIITLAI
jgi:hypothetical protein